MSGLLAVTLLFCIHLIQYEEYRTNCICIEDDILMKLKLCIIFFIAFIGCAGWSLWTDTSKPARTDFTVSQTQDTSWWSAPLEPLRQKAYPYLHFQDAMKAKLKPLPMYVSIRSIPKTVQNAVIATEDKRFYDHGAIDLIGIIRATAVNLYSGETLQGGSTISQQVVKNVFLSQERTWSRKGQEIVLAFLLEHYYSKEEILEIYLNTAYFGANATGIYEASQTYYNSKPDELRLSQAAMLAGLLQAPTYYNPLENYDAARARQKIVLTLLAEQGYISAGQAASAYKEPLHLER